MQPAPEPFVFDHFGIVCRDTAAARRSFGPVHGVSAWSDEFHDPIQKVNVQFGFSPHAPVIELIEPHGPDSPIAQVLERKADILNHIAYRVAALEAALDHCRALGYFAISAPAPAVAYGGNQICFLYSPGDFIIELVEGLEFEHQFVNPAGQEQG